MKRHTRLAMGCAVGFLGLFCLADVGVSAWAQTMRYQRDVQPILSQAIQHCHGGDTATRQGSYELDALKTAKPAELGQSCSCAGSAGGK